MVPAPSGKRMAILLVTYDLIRESHSENYEKILAVIKSGGSWARLSESSYAMETSMSPETVYNQVKPYLTQRDRLLVLTLKTPCFGYHDKEVIDWLDSKLTY